MEDSSNAIRLQPNFEKAYHRRAHSYLALKNYKLAVADFERILQHNPNDAEI